MLDYGSLSSYFDNIAAKTLAAVDLYKAGVSNQHEFNATKELKSIFGEDDLQNIPSIYITLDDDAEPIFEHGFCTWYNARRNHPTRNEYRLYYSTNEVFQNLSAGDLMILAVQEAKRVLFIFAPKNTTVNSQLRWLFGLEDVSEKKFNIRFNEGQRINALGAYILEQIGVEVLLPLNVNNFIEDMDRQFNSNWPSSSVFSSYAISTIPNLDWKENPDQCLVDCFEREEMLFRIFERHLLEREMTEHIQPYFDMDAVLRLTMSVFQRRKARAGKALENHLAYLFKQRKIQFSSQKYTERKSKPDFLFPSIECYQNQNFPANLLTMLAAKTTIKERWRQVLDEADRITHKHLITLQPAVSEDYIMAMQKNNLQLVVPKPILSSYSTDQQDSLMSVLDFCELVEERQSVVS